MTTDARATRLRTEIRPARSLSAEESGRLLHLFSGYFADVDAWQFAADLAEKDSVVLLIEEPSGIIQGFSTLGTIRAEVDGEPVIAFFSGDTVIAPEHWSKTAWLREWIRHVLARKEESGLARAYWLLLTSTHKSYRFLPAFFRKYYPSRHWPTPLEVSRRIAALVRQKFPEEFDSAGGVVRLQKPTPVRAPWDTISPEKLGDPEIAFFAAANPGHGRGDFLCCLAELDLANITPTGWRVIGDVPKVDVEKAPSDGFS